MDDISQLCFYICLDIKNNQHNKEMFLQFCEIEVLVLILLVFTLRIRLINFITIYLILYIL